jgi:hypothetical protein
MKADDDAGSGVEDEPIKLDPIKLDPRARYAERNLAEGPKIFALILRAFRLFSEEVTADARYLTALTEGIAYGDVDFDGALTRCRQALENLQGTYDKLARAVSKGTVG